MRIVAISLLAGLIASGTHIHEASAGGIVAGTYSCPQITVTAQGQITAIAKGNCGGGLVAIQRFTVHGIYTFKPDTGTNVVLVRLVGAGGSGSGCIIPAAGSANLGQTAGGGAYLEKLLTTNFDGKKLVIGQGGAPSEPGQNPGQNGGDTVFDPESGKYRAGGGAGGSGMNFAPYGWQVLGEAAGGEAVNGDLNESGQTGGPNTSLFLGTLTTSSVGANSQYGQGGLAEVIGGTVSLPGASGIGNGSGGSGGICLSSGPDEPGGAGTDGYAEFDEYR